MSNYESNNTDAGDEYESSAKKGTAYISGITFGPKKVKYSIRDGFAVFEGDIILGKAEELEKNPGSEKAAAIVGQRFRWPSGFIPFTIDPNLPNKNRVTEAIDHWHINTPIRFIPHTTEENWVNFTTAAGVCQSSVGMQGNGRQQIFLDQNCGLRQVKHEIGHTVGLWHEQSRTDRNSFVRINLENVIPLERDNFDQLITESAGTAYDYCSIMHYDAFAFSVNGLPTITVLQPTRPCGGTIGLGNDLSQGDMSAIYYLYVPTIVPNVHGIPATDAANDVKAAQLIPKFTGNGEWVSSQSPSHGRSVPRGTIVNMRTRTGPPP